jgi:hypothetical protein
VKVKVRHVALVAFGCLAAIGSGEPVQAQAPPGAVEPYELCGHLARILIASGAIADPAVATQIVAGCENEMTIERELRGEESWTLVTTCVMAATTEAEVQRCDDMYPVPAAPAVPPGVDATRERQACAHVIDVFVEEETAVIGAPPQMGPEERLAIIEECAGTLVAGRLNQSAEDYERSLRCIEQAQTSAQLNNCE